MLLVIVQLLPYHAVIHVAVNHLAADIGTLLQGGTIPQPGM